MPKHGYALHGREGGREGGEGREFSGTTLGGGATRAADVYGFTRAREARFLVVVAISSSDRSSVLMLALLEFVNSVACLAYVYYVRSFSHNKASNDAEDY